MSTVREAAQAAHALAPTLANLSAGVRNSALIAMADHLLTQTPIIIAANEVDLARAQAEGLSAPLIKRLRFDEAKLAETAAGLRALAALEDPLGRTELSTELTPGLSLYRISCPLGVIGVIFESRPDALVQIASLCLKSGNAVLLKGGREALETNRALFAALMHATHETGIPDGWATLLESREEVQAMLALDDCIDLIIPRGSNAFVRHILENSRIPVMGHADGICHMYVDQAADAAMAVRLAVDSKAQYVAVCNAMETLLVHQNVDPAFWPALAKGMAEAGVTLRGCPRTREHIACEAADDADWDTEYLDYILSIRVVDSAEEAIAHIHRHGSGHTDAIVTQSEQTAAQFLQSVDSAGVYWNCSTRFADGFRYGFGAEVGVSTGKIHARGPVGLQGLCIYKYKMLGNGQTVADSVNGTFAYTHRPLGQDCPI